MKNKADFHLHSNHSDGVLTIQQILEVATKNNVSYFALTDHDTVNGIDELFQYKNQSHIKVITGIELSAKCQHGSLHILAYNFDHTSKILLNKLLEFNEARDERNKKIIGKLQKIGIQVSYEELLQESSINQTIGRPLIATLLIKKNIVKNMREAFKRYLEYGASAYVDKEIFTTKEIIEFMDKVSGQCFIAHPSSLKLQDDELYNCIKDFKDQGLFGLEVYHPSATVEFSRYLSKICTDLDLEQSAGSDYHGNKDFNIPIGSYAIEKDITMNHVSSWLVENCH